MTPRVSIGLPVYNGETYLDAAIESIRAQTMGDFELIISDNASTDATAAIAARHAAQDARIRINSEPDNLGAGPNFARCLELAGGEYFRWHAHDDLIEPTYLERCVALLDAAPDVPLCHSTTDIIDDDGHYIDTLELDLDFASTDIARRYRDVALGWHLCHEVFGVMRRTHLRELGGMGSFPHADGVLLEQLVLAGPFAVVPETLFHNRRHAGQSMDQFGVNEGSVDYHAYAQWFDQRASRFRFPHWRMVFESWRGWFRARIDMRSRLRTLPTLVRRTARYRRHLLADLRRSAMVVLRRG